MTDTVSVPVANDGIAAFADLSLSDSTRRALQKMGIETPTPIQAQALPVLLAGRDLIGQARTGSGKTLAFGIPAVEFVDPRLRDPQVLVLTPTRELAVQVANVLRDLVEGRGISVVTIFGGVGVGPQRMALRQSANIVVGTPGRVLDLLNQGALRLNKIRLLVLDEADEMLDFGFAPDVERIIGRATPDRQTALFSATVPEWVQKTASKHLIDPVTVALPVDPDEAPSIEHVAFDVPDGDKVGVLKDLLAQPSEGQTIVFGRTKRGVARLAKRLVAEGYPVVALQGDMAQGARDRVMAEFRSGQAPILLATNVAARGIDVTSVGLVINAELPESPALLTHRIGRTGRMGRQGMAITLIAPEDQPKWRQLTRGLAVPIARAPWPGAGRALEGGFEVVAEPELAPARGRRTGRAQTTSAPAGRMAPPRSGRQPERAPRQRPLDAETPRSRPMPTQAAPVARAANGAGTVSDPLAQLVSEVSSRTGSGRRPAASSRDERPATDGGAPAPRERAGERPVGVRLANEAPRAGDVAASGNGRPAGNRYGRPAPAGAPKVKAAMAARAAAGSWEAFDAETAPPAPAQPERHADAGERPERGNALTPPERVRTAILCSGCGRTAFVSFDPDPTRPVYCARCHAQRRSGNAVEAAGVR